MPTSGDVIDIDLGMPEGQEAGFRHPAVFVTAQRILTTNPSVIHVVPLTSTIREFDSETTIGPEAINGLARRSAAQCQHLRAVSPARIIPPGQCRARRAGPAPRGRAVVLDLPI
jgi:mRNA interferase MazF